MLAGLLGSHCPEAVEIPMANKMQARMVDRMGFSFRAQRSGV
jgi:hypothetical protein